MHLSRILPKIHYISKMKSGNKYLLPLCVQRLGLFFKKHFLIYLAKPTTILHFSLFTKAILAFFV